MTEQDIIDNRIEELESVKLPCDINFINGKVGKGCTLYTLQLRILNHGRALQGWIDKLQARLEEIGNQEPVAVTNQAQVDHLKSGIHPYIPLAMWKPSASYESLTVPLYTHAPDSAARIAELEAENAELKQRQQWQPIETAPKDGAHLAWQDGKRPYVIVWLDADHPDADGHGWYEHWTFGPVEPTHWMPLPDAPAIDAANGGA